MTRLREGYTTGSCAAAAAKAAALQLLTGTRPPKVRIATPVGRSLLLPVSHLGEGICAVIKDGGDDPDVTTGMMIVVELKLAAEPGPIQFFGGEGVGKVTLPGLKIPPGEPAINPIPRQMIKREVRQIIASRGAHVRISIPGGRERAKGTFNPRLGIVGGLSILGTTGFVRPMSNEAIKESIALEMAVKKEQGQRALALVFGASGERSLTAAFRLPPATMVQMSNYVGFALEKATKLGFNSVLMGGHPGKLVKLAAGIFQTHSQVADARMETLCAFAALMGAPPGVLKEIYGARTTEGAMEIIAANKLTAIWHHLAEAAANRCQIRAGGELEVAVAFIDNGGRILGHSSNTEGVAAEVKGDV